MDCKCRWIGINGHRNCHDKIVWYLGTVVPELDIREAEVEIGVTRAVRLRPCSISSMPDIIYREVEMVGAGLVVSIHQERTELNGNALQRRWADTAKGKKKEKKRIDSISHREMRMLDIHGANISSRLLPCATKTETSSKRN